MEIKKYKLCIVNIIGYYAFLHNDIFRHARYNMYVYTDTSKHRDRYLIFNKKDIEQDNFLYNIINELDRWRNEG